MSDNKIYLSGGSKGGTGKSMVCIALIDHLVSINKKTIFIETDTSNQDVWKSHKDEITSELIDLDDGDGWIQLVSKRSISRVLPLLMKMGIFKIPR